VIKPAVGCSSLDILPSMGIEETIDIASHLLKVSLVAI
jgi:hypothetical protein